MTLNWLAVALGIVLPWAACVLWLRPLWPKGEPGAWPLAIGYGWLLSALGLALLLRAMAAIGLSPGVVIPLLVFGLLGFVGWRRAWRGDGLALAVPGRAPLPGWRLVLLALLVSLIGLRVLGLALEAWWHPLFAWDAWTTWVFRAKAWAELGRFVPFVGPSDWLNDASGAAYTITAADYPMTVSLIALWPVLAHGGWSESAANLPWVGCVLALGLGFYGQARLWAVPPVTALVFVYLLLSLPLLDTHVALAGYADLWLATSLGLGAIAFFQWIRVGDPKQLALAVVLTLACLAIKREGAAWALLFPLAWLAARLPGRWWLGLLVGCALGVAALWSIGGVSLNLPVLGLIEMRPSLIQLPLIGRFELEYHDSWAAVWRHLFIYDNWHLLGYLLPLALVVALFQAVRPGSEPWLRAQTAFVLGSLLLLYVLFFMTGAHLWAEKSTSINRLILHFAPLYIFWMMSLWHLRSVSTDQRPDGVGECRAGQPPLPDGQAL